MDNLNKRRESLSFERVAVKRQRSKYLRWSKENPLLWVFGLLLVYVLIVLIVGINLGAKEAKITQSALGSIAMQDYKAPRDFEYNRIDWEATERERKERESEVLPIYHWDAGALEASVLRVGKAFEMMREGMAQQREQEILRRLPRLLRWERTESIEKEIRSLAMSSLFKSLDDNEAILQTIGVDDGEDEAGVAESMRLWADANKEDFTEALGSAMSDEVYFWLYQQNFSQAVQSQIVAILDSILGRKLVASQRMLAGVKAINLHWDEGGERKSKQYNDAELATITDMDSSLTMMRSMVDSIFRDAPRDIFDVFVQFLKPNIVYDEAATLAARRSVSAQTPELRVRQSFQKGQTIVSNGDPINQEHIDIYAQLLENQSDPRGKFAHWASLATIIAILLILLWRPLKSDYWGRQRGARDLLYFAFNLIALAFFLRVYAAIAHTIEMAWNLQYSLLLLFPFAAGSMLIRLVINRQYAFLFSVSTIVLAAIVSDGSVFLLAFVVVTSIAGALMLERPKSRSLVLQRGFMIGVLGAAMAVASIVLSPADFSVLQLGVMALLSITGGFVAATAVTIGLPIAESLFGYATTTKLLELSNLDHPALKALFMEAPGTYQHSMMVGSLNEAAAEAIGANAVLARIGGYYHDIGKVKNAQYFAENQRGDNPHNRLRPNMSALILKTHVKDGIELAKKHKLPQDIIDFIATHHGTSRIEYFYQRAKQQEENVREEDYRYPGPRPQSRETGICMVSDMVEAAVRSLPDKNPDKIKYLVHKLINHKFADGQFDECDLTLRDLNEIANAVLAILNAVYHTRPEYPEQRRERERAEEKKKLEAERQAKDKKDKEEAQEQTEKREAASTGQDSGQSKKIEKAVEGAKQKSEKQEKQEKTEKSDERVQKNDSSAKAEKSEKKISSKEDPSLKKSKQNDSQSNKKAPLNEDAAEQQKGEKPEETPLDKKPLESEEGQEDSSESTEEYEDLSVETNAAQVSQADDPHVPDFVPNLNVFKKQ
ncbi:MAG: HDIG domain-containing metalloprotein [Bradymonadales bacterium]|jgi:putative nucleotidyltransferase with HDIG domain